MKKLLFLLCFTGFFLTKSNAQKSKNDADTEGVTKVQIRLSTGSNNLTSLFGVGLNVRLHDKFFGVIGTGIGGWGLKYAIGGKYEFRYGSGWSVNANFSQSSGAKNVKTTVDVQTEGRKEITMDFKKASALNLSMAYNWAIKKRHAFFLEFGYSVPLNTKPWVVTSGETLTNTSELALKWVQPGGLIFNVGFNLGI